MSLYENQLESLGPGVFGPMPLKELWLYDNKLSRVEDDTFRNLTQLHLLVLSRNQINYVSAGDLQRVGEGGRDITSHQSASQPCKLGLSKVFPAWSTFPWSITSSAHSLWVFLEGVSHLGQIDLRNNSFNNMPQESLDALTVTNEVLLQQNPWRCDKDILPLRDWLRQHPTQGQPNPCGV